MRTSAATVVGLAALGTLFAGYMLVSDYRSSGRDQGPNAGRTPVGSMILTENNVKRQYEADVLWNPIIQNGTVYNHDSIRTGPASRAAVKLANNNLVELSENSLIEIDQDPANTAIEFKAGNITATGSSQNLQIKVNGATITTKQGSEVQLHNNMAGKAQIQVKRGQIFLSDKHHKNMAVGENQIVKVSDGAAATTASAAIALESPDDEQTVYGVSSSIPVTFHWTFSDPNIHMGILQLSDNAEFPEKRTLEVHSETSSRLVLKPGVYFWRVKALVPGRRMVSETRNLTVEKEDRLILEEPENGITMKADTKVRFRWTSRFPAKTPYRLQVAKDSEFKNLLSNQVLSTIEAVPDLNASGTLFWRVAVLDDSGKEILITPPHWFTIKTPTLTLTLIAPAADSLIHTTIPAFSWRPLTQAKQYEISVYNEDGTLIGRSTSNRSPAQARDHLAFGAYSWDVKALDGSGHILAQSARWKFQVSADNIVLTAPASRAFIPQDANTPVNFAWHYSKDFAPQKAALVLSSTKTFDHPLRYEVGTNTDKAVSLKAGVYYWKIEASQADGAAGSATIASDTRTFKIGLTEGLAPQIIAPSDQSNVDADHPTSVTFKWKGPPQLRYHIKVIKHSEVGEDEVIVDRIMRGQSYLSHPLPLGHYQWQISALSVDGDEGPATSAQFTLAQPQLLSAPQLNAPVVK